MKANLLPYRLCLGAITMSCALLLLSPATAEAKGRHFSSFGGGFHGSSHGSGFSTGIRRGSRSFGSGKNFIVSSRYDNRHHRRSNIIVHRSSGHSKLLRRSRLNRLHRRRFRNSNVVYYDTLGSRRTRVENTIVVPPAQTEPAPQAAPARPFEPKIIEIAALPRNADGSIALAPQTGTLSKRPNNCLTVKRQITVDGQTMDAFGKACMDADGSWTLSPDG